MPESQPLVLLEALAAGTPVVTTTLGAIPEMITDGREGYFIGSGDVDEPAGAFFAHSKSRAPVFVGRAAAAPLRAGLQRAGFC